MAGSRHQTFSAPGFRDGVNNVFREDSVPANQLRHAVNVDLLPDGKIRRRSGYTRRLSLPACRSAASHLGRIYMASEGKLVQVDPRTYDHTEVANVDAFSYLSFESLNEKLYFTDGVSTFLSVLPSGDAVSVAPENPSRQPDVSTVAMGSLPAGRYQVAITFVRAGGEESGTGRAALASLTQEGSIQLQNIPVPAQADIQSVNVYCSHASGEILYRVATLSAGTTSFTVSTVPNGKALETQFLQPLPVGSIVRSHNARLYVARRRELYFSEAFRFGQHNPWKNYVSFDSDITMIRPVESGMYVSTEHSTYFLRGQDPLANDFAMTQVHEYGAVRGTDTLVRAGMFSFENLSTGHVAVWWSTNGTMIVGLPNGQVQPLREGELSLPEFERGSVSVREYNGVQQLVSTLKNPKTPSSALAATDEFTVTVHRNGIEV